MLLRFYDVKNKQNILGKLPDLRDKASSSSSMIQAYVDYVLAQANFSSYANKDIKEMGEKYNWTANFRNLDDHLVKAKDNAVSWNTDVYPSMKSLWTDLDRFSQSYIKSYGDIEPNLMSIKRKKIDNDVIEQKVQEEEGFWTYMNFPRFVTAI